MRTQTSDHHNKDNILRIIIEPLQKTEAHKLLR